MEHGVGAVGVGDGRPRREVRVTRGLYYGTMVACTPLYFLPHMIGLLLSRGHQMITVNSQTYWHLRLF